MKIDKKSTNLNVFLVGIGGISMSGIAKILKNNNMLVSGSDAQCNKEIEILESLGIKVSIGHRKSNINKEIDLIIFSGAIPHDNPELVRAGELGIKIMERSEFLGELSKTFKHTIAISGTHGKTTTTAMIGEIFLLAGFNPTIHLGGRSVNINNNTYIGDNDYLIIEACEYRESFRFLTPECLVITNIESDHLDYYRDLEHIYRAFDNLAKQSKTVITSNEIIIHNSKIDTKDYSAENIKIINHAYEYDVYYKGEFITHIRLNMIGKHNIENSLFAIAVAREYQINIDIIKKALSEFRGVERRYECIGSIDSVPVIIDYAHHPTEIARSIEGIKEVYSEYLIIFQPHTYSRTITLFDDFVQVLRQEKNLIIYNTYPAREKEIIGGRAEDLSRAITHSIFSANLDNLVTFICGKCKNPTYQCILVLGAGDLAIDLKKYINQTYKKV